MWFNFLDRYRDAGLLILRLGMGLFYMFEHGMDKLLGGPEQWQGLGERAEYVGIEFLPGMWGFMASFAEFFGGLLLILGLFFRPAAFLLLCTMIVATAFHIGSGIGSPVHSGKMAVLFFSLLFIGPGKYSLDNYFWPSRRRRRFY